MGFKIVLIQMTTLENVCHMVLLSMSGSWPMYLDLDPPDCNVYLSMRPIIDK